MPLNGVPEILRIEFCTMIARRLGFHFPLERWPDVQRGLEAAAAELGLADITACIDRLVSPTATKIQWLVLGRHLTIGETYFFREKKTLEALTEKILPAVIYARRRQDRRLRFWSAACCTGEEAYTLSILLQQIIPDIADWQVSILATDLNEKFLQRAAAGVYGEWSFRDAPPWLKEQYFRRTPDGRYAILPEIKKRVTFAQLNLVEDSFPSLTTDTNAMDVIFCRNVLMYFTPPQARKVVTNLHRSLVDEGWLAVSPSECSQRLFSEFSTENFPGVILYRKGPVKEPAPPPWVPPPAMPAFPLVPQAEAPPEPPTAPPAPPSQGPPSPSALALATEAYAEGRYAEASALLLALAEQPATADHAVFSLLARALANQGRLTEARAWCGRWLAADKLDPAAHYLQAMILQEVGEPTQAGQALQRAIYLDQRFILAHFALGNLARDRGRPAEAGKHFTNALRLLRHCGSADILPEADGLTAGRLTEIISSFGNLAAAS